MLSSVASLPPKIRVSDSCTRPQPPPPDCQGAHDEGNDDDNDDNGNNDADGSLLPKPRRIALLILFAFEVVTMRQKTSNINLKSICWS